MSNVKKSHTLPAGSIAGEGFGQIDYADVYSILLGETTPETTVDHIFTQIMSTPPWVSALLGLRNRIVSLFGLNTELPAPQKADYYPVGSRAGGFTVLTRNEHQIVTGEDDKHLIFRAAVQVNPATRSVHLVTLVQYHNPGGRLYFALIKPFHGLIMRTQMARLLRENLPQKQPL